MQINIEIQGLKQLRKLLDDDLYIREWKDGMVAFAEEGQSQAHGEAPRLTGKLAASIKAGVSRKPFPTWARVRVFARRRGFPYPRLLAFSHRHGHRDWLINAVRGTIDYLPRELEKIGNAIARRWERG